ncbi:MAG TPA: NapC/NirT family cytochrome c [Anaeromyxobacteraceae bacterium]|nr:NapC/NirT family cytochrome c [Anaeromyxobacteraceae bacterium]
MIHSFQDLLKIGALAGAAVSIAIIVWYLAKRPPLGRLAKMLLFLGLGVFPTGVALMGNIAGFEYTKTRQFCGSCHVMGPYVRDAGDASSKSLASAHSRNKWFGHDSCYTCHADYGMFGAVATKVTGLSHLYHYVTEYATTGPDGEGGRPLKLYKRQDMEKKKITEEQFTRHLNGICKQCHSTDDPIWIAAGAHEGALADLRTEKVACIDCHSDIHPTALHRRQKQARTEEGKP